MVLKKILKTILFVFVALLIGVTLKLLLCGIAFLISLIGFASFQESLLGLLIALMIVLMYVLVE